MIVIYSIIMFKKVVLILHIYLITTPRYTSLFSVL